MYHHSDGLYFERLPNGAVKIIKRESAAEDSPVVFEKEIDGDQWCSIVAGMTKSGGDALTYAWAKEMHG